MKVRIIIMRKRGYNTEEIKHIIYAIVKTKWEEENPGKIFEEGS